DRAALGEARSSHRARLAHGARMIPTPTPSPSWRATLAATLLCALTGCASHVALPPGSAGNTPTVPAGNAERLRRLAESRASQAAAGDYVLGPSDVVSVKAFDLEDVNQKVRVDGNGDITLPLLNSVPVAGKTVAQVQDDLT